MLLKVQLKLQITVLSTIIAMVTDLAAMIPNLRHEQTKSFTQIKIVGKWKQILIAALPYHWGMKTKHKIQS